MINEIALISNVQEKLLGITFNSELKFEKNVTGICKKTSQNNFFSRIEGLMSLNKRSVLKERTLLLLRISVQ